MYLSEMISEVRSRLGEDAADFWSDDEVLRAVNEGQRRFLNEEKWFWLYTTGTAQLLPNQDTLPLQEGVAFTRAFNIMLKSSAVVYPLLPIRVSPSEGFRARRRFFLINGFPRWYYVDRIVQNQEAQSLNTIVQVSLPQCPTSGTWKLTMLNTVGGTATDTAAIAYNATAATVEAALEAAFTGLTAITSRTGDGVLVPYTWTIEFGGTYAGLDISPFTPVTGTAASQSALLIASIDLQAGHSSVTSQLQQTGIAQSGSGEAGHQLFTPCIRFVPKPSLAFSVEYQYLADVNDMSADEDEPFVPDDWQGAILAWATAQLWLKELSIGNQKSQEQLGLYNKILHDAEDEQRRMAVDDVVAWGKEEPELVGRQTLEDWVFGRIPPSVGA